MYWFRIEQTLQPTEREPATGECAAVLLSSAELERKPALSGLESVLAPHAGGAGCARMQGRAAARLRLRDAAHTSGVEGRQCSCLRVPDNE